MPRYLIPFLKTIAQIAWLMLLYTVFRLMFLCFNSTSFPGLTTRDGLYLLANGLRFDLSVITLINALFIAWGLFPYGKKNGNGRALPLRIIFLTTNIAALLFEAADWAYFPFNHKRSTAEVLNMLTRKGDFLSLLPGFAIEYWYLFLLAIAFSVILWLGYRNIERKFTSAIIPTASGNLLVKQALLFVVGIGLSVLGMRGGWQLVPINLRNAIKVTRSEYTPIVLNTPFSILNSLSSQRLQEVHYMPQRQAMALVQPVKKYNHRRFRKKNVVVIILESFSREFTGLGGREHSYTPFLDSLSAEGFVYRNAYANGLHSADGIPAVLAGIPSLMDEPFTTSVYSTNRITSIASLLKKTGYQTSFFHGATNGSMSFDVFARSAGFDAYYGRKEYNNERDYDGSWGIYDEPFLQYFARHLGQGSQPFFATVFTVTSHPPYPIPAAYKGRFPKGKLQIMQSVGYTDYALRRFFETATQQSWYNNTLFVITADHCSPRGSIAYYEMGPGRYEIPLLLFAPGDQSLKGSSNEIVQQIDILPTVMDYLGYPAPFFALGQSALDTTAQRFVTNNLSGVHQWISNGYRLEMAHHTLDAFFTVDDGIVGRQNLVKVVPRPAGADSALTYWKAFIQLYTQAMTDNKMDAEKYGKAQR